MIYDNTPCILKETSAGYFRANILDDMLQRREVEYVGEVNAESVYALCRQLRYLERQGPAEEITMFINSPGGSVDDGLALYDIMKGLSCPVRTVCLGIAASMGAVLFAAGDRRDILPHGRVMIHDPRLCRTGGSALQLQETAHQLMETRRITAQLLAQHTGKSLTAIYRKTAKDSWFAAREAVEFGLADRIIEHI